jgi:N-acyl-D-aspartate/D-glutamate deacylase
LVEQAGRPMAITILQRDARPEEWRDITGWIADANRSGVPMLAQVLTRPTGIILGFEISQNPFLGRPSYDAIDDLPFEAKIAELRRPERRAAILSEDTDNDSLRRRVRRWDRMFPMSDPPDYEPPPEDSIAARAARMGRDPAELAYALLLEKNGRTLLYRPLSNYTYGNLDTVHDMLEHEATIVGLGDGGAHVGILSDASALTTMLTHWTRDRKGPRFSLPWAVKRISRDSAWAIGLHDRGVVANGYKADLNVIDYDRLRVRAPAVVYDLPTGGRRLIQRADGYDVTILSGVPVSRNGEATGALPGRLVRGARAIP